VGNERKKQLKIPGKKAPAGGSGKGGAKKTKKGDLIEGRLRRREGAGGGQQGRSGFPCPRERGGGEEAGADPDETKTERPLRKKEIPIRKQKSLAAREEEGGKPPA